jgi:hypothetical protein
LSALKRFSGQPESPKPPTRRVWLDWTSYTAAAEEAKILDENRLDAVESIYYYSEIS